MKRHALRWFVFLLAASTGHAAAQSPPSFDPADPLASFETMAEYLARDGGRWRGENPNHDPENPRSPPAFGLWFDRVFDGRILELRIVVHHADRTVVSSQGQWVWHPGRKELAYRMVDRGGGVTEGATRFSDARTFTTVATRTGREGREMVHKDDNVLVSEAVHENETFRREGDDWVSGGVYEWRREASSGDGR